LAGGEYPTYSCRTLNLEPGNLNFELFVTEGSEMAFNVLIIDDSSTMRSLIRKIMGIAGFPVGQYFEGANGREALEILNHECVDVILTDLNMPEMDGKALLQTIRGKTDWKDLPVILITTERRPEILSQYSRLGFQGIINKPFRPETIKQVLSEIMGEPDVATIAESEGCDF